MSDAGKHSPRRVLPGGARCASSAASFRRSTCSRTSPIRPTGRLLISAEQKTNPRLMETIGNLDLVPPERRVAGPGASYLMAPFTHVSPDRPSRFSRRRLRRALCRRPFRGGAVRDHPPSPALHGAHQGAGRLDLAVSRARARRRRQAARSARGDAAYAAALDPDDYAASQALGAQLRAAGSDGVVYPSVRCASGECVGLFYPDLAANPVQGRHLDYHWDGARVDLYRDAGAAKVFRIV